MVRPTRHKLHYNYIISHILYHFICSENEDPTVRGLALRSICSLRLESILEYIQLPLHKSLTDVSAYVRKTGVMGILKVYCCIFVFLAAVIQSLIVSIALEFSFSSLFFFLSL